MNTAAIILAAYFRQKPAKEALRAAITEVGIKRRPSEFSRLQAAVGTVLLGATRRAFGGQEELDREGLSLGSREVRHWGSFKPKRICAINWGESVWGPLPTDYFAVRVRENVVVVLSAPTTGFVGHFDVALGHFAGGVNTVDGLHHIITKHWETMGGFGMERPEQVLRTGIVSEALVQTWLDSVWDNEEAG